MRASTGSRGSTQDLLLQRNRFQTQTPSPDEYRLSPNSSTNSSSTPNSGSSHDRSSGMNDLVEDNATEPSSGFKRFMGLGKGSKKNKYEALKKYSHDLIFMATQGQRPRPVIGRDAEIERLMTILSSKNKMTPILVGDVGVGKKTIVEGLARRMALKENIKSNLLNVVKLAKLDNIKLLDERYAVGSLAVEVEARLESILRDIERFGEGKVIVFIDDIHHVLGGGGGAAELIKSMISKGRISCIGATTVEMYRKHIESDSTMEKRVQAVPVAEPSVEDVVCILKGLKEEFESSCGVPVKDDALVVAAHLSHKYVNERRMPQKAIDLMDEACASVREQLASQPQEIGQLEQKIMELEVNHLALERENDKASKVRLFEVREEIEALKEKLKHLKLKYEVVKEKITQMNILKHNREELMLALQKAKTKMEELTKTSNMHDGDIRRLEIAIASKEQDLREKLMLPTLVEPEVIVRILKEGIDDLDITMQQLKEEEASFRSRLNEEIKKGKIDNGVRSAMEIMQRKWIEKMPIEEPETIVPQEIEAFRRNGTYWTYLGQRANKDFKRPIIENILKVYFMRLQLQMRYTEECNWLGELYQLKKQREELICVGEAEKNEIAKVAELESGQIQKVEMAIIKLEEEISEDYYLFMKTVGPEEVAQTVSKWTGIPVEKLHEDIRQMLNDGNTFPERVVGNDEEKDIGAKSVFGSGHEGLSSQPGGVGENVRVQLGSGSDVVDERIVEICDYGMAPEEARSSFDSSAGPSSRQDGEITMPSNEQETEIQGPNEEVSSIGPRSSEQTEIKEIDDTIYPSLGSSDWKNQEKKPKAGEHENLGLGGIPPHWLPYPGVERDMERPVLASFFKVSMVGEDKQDMRSRHSVLGRKPFSEEDDEDEHPQLQRRRFGHSRNVPSLTTEPPYVLRPSVRMESGGPSGSGPSEPGPSMPSLVKRKFSPMRETTMDYQFQMLASQIASFEDMMRSMQRGFMEEMRIMHQHHMDELQSLRQDTERGIAAIHSELRNMRTQYAQRPTNDYRDLYGLDR